MLRTKTICPYCGCGCGIEVIEVNGRYFISPDRNNPVNHGKLCIKGRYLEQLVSALKHRPRRPMLRKGEKFVEVSWKEAIKVLAEELKRDEKAFVSSAKCTNEENYLMQKLARTLGTNNVDHCARLCHSPTVCGLVKTLGSGAMTNPIDDIAKAECVFVIGANPFEQHPLVAYRILKSKKVIVVDPRKTATARNAKHIQNYPGTNVALLNAIAKVVIEEELYDSEFIEERVEGFENLAEFLRRKSLENLAGICGVSVEDIRNAAHSVAKRTAFVYCMGLTQFTSGTDAVIALSNLAVITGNVAGEGCGIFPLRGQNNVQGACDMGALPEFFPGYRRVCEENKSEFEELWNAELSCEEGLKLPEMIDEAGKDVKVMYIMGENPVKSEPNSRKVRKKLSELDFLAVQDIFFTETAEIADLFIPVASWIEKDGTFTNTERRIQRIRKVINSEFPADWEILSRFGRELSLFSYSNVEEIFEEIKKAVKAYSVKIGEQWGGRILHAEKFATPSGKARIIPVEYRDVAEKPDESYPFLLTTGRVAFHFHTRSMTGKCEALNEEVSEAFVEINGKDAEKLGIRNGSKVTVETRRGKIRAKVRISDIKEGVIFVPFHFDANELTSDFLDEESGIPELKACAARIVV